MFKKPDSALEMEELVKERVVLSNVGRWVDAIEECNNRRFYDRRFLNRALLCFVSADRNARLLKQTRVQSYSQYYRGNAAMLMKSSKDDFQHVKNQLQGGIALMSFVQRMGIDKGADLSSFAKVRFYAATLFHTKRLPDATKMERLKEELDRREAEQKRYAGILGIICVQNNKITLAQLREGCKQVSLDWRRRNDFAEFP